MVVFAWFPPVKIRKAVWGETGDSWPWKQTMFGSNLLSDSLPSKMK